MSVFSNIITPQGLEPLQLPTKFRSHSALDTYHTQAEAWFGISRDEGEPLLKQIHEQTQAMSSLFDVPTGELGDPDEILADAEEALLQITLQSQQQNQQLSSQVSTDALTGAANRRAFDEFLQKQFELATSSRPVSVLFTDVDHFKKFNDTHGHELGDRVLIAVANTLQTAVGEEGRVFRYGGEEFAIVCPTSDAESASQLAERTRRAVADQARVGRHDDTEELSVTCSIGVMNSCGGHVRSCGAAPQGGRRRRLRREGCRTKLRALLTQRGT